MKAVSTWDLPGSRGQNHGIFGPFPLGSGTERMLGDLPHVPGDPPPPATRVSWQGGDPCWARASCGTEACEGVGSSWGCGKVGLWTIVDASSLASVVVLHTYPHLFSPLLSGHHLPSHSRWQPDPLHWRFIEPPEHQTQGAWTPLSYHAWGSRHTWLHRHERREALGGRRLPRIPRLINSRAGL